VCTKIVEGSHSHSNEDEAVLGTRLLLQSNIGNISNTVSGKENKCYKYSDFMKRSHQKHSKRGGEK